MGIKDLNKFLKERAPNAIKQLMFSDLSKLLNKEKKELKVAIDTSIYFYKFLYKNPRFIEGFFQQIARLRSNNITPIYVFDGKPPCEKKDVLNDRKEKKIEYKNKISEIENTLNNNNLSEEEIIQNKIELSKLKKNV